MMREMYIDELYSEVRGHVPITRDAYGQSLEGWDIAPVMIDGSKIGLMVTKGSEIHMKLDKRLILLHARRVIGGYVEPMLRRCGALTTRALKGSADIRFLERLGFTEIGMEGKLVLFRLETLKIR